MRSADNDRNTGDDTFRSDSDASNAARTALLESLTADDLMKPYFKLNPNPDTGKNFSLPGFELHETPVPGDAPKQSPSKDADAAADFPSISGILRPTDNLGNDGGSAEKISNIGQQIKDMLSDLKNKSVPPNDYVAPKLRSLTPEGGKHAPATPEGHEPNPVVPDTHKDKPQPYRSPKLMDLNLEGGGKSEAERDAAHRGDRGAAGILKDIAEKIGAAAEDAAPAPRTRMHEGARRLMK